MRFRLLAVSTLAIGFLAGSGSAFSQEYPYCSGEGPSVGQSCAYETRAQCDAAVLGLNVPCFKNPSYTAPAVAAPEPPPAPAAAPAPKKRRTTSPSGTKS